MNLKFDLSFAVGYKSRSQIARVLTEGWVKQNSYCPSCGNDHLSRFENNSPVADFLCTNCEAEYELKSKKNGHSLKIVDGAYDSMIQRINADNNPHFFFLNYSDRTHDVHDFLVIPKHYFFDEIIERRSPLKESAQRAGWIGCNILLQNIPSSGKIFLVKDRKVVSRKSVVETWSNTSFLANQKKENRGWAIEVMRIVERIKGKNFKLQDVYAFEQLLKQKFPNNNFVKDKIRQQLQVLRDKGLIVFKGNGLYQKLNR